MSGLDSSGNPIFISPIPVAVIGLGGAPALVSIAVTPASPSIATGADKQFTATGTYADASTADLTSSVTWASDTPSVATIDATTGDCHRRRSRARPPSARPWARSAAAPS